MGTQANVDARVEERAGPRVLEAEREPEGAPVSGALPEGEAEIELRGVTQRYRHA